MVGKRVWRVTKVVRKGLAPTEILPAGSGSVHFFVRVRESCEPSYRYSATAEASDRSLNSLTLATLVIKRSSLINVVILSAYVRMCPDHAARSSGISLL
jgi:hypothetical protein